MKLASAAVVTALLAATAPAHAETDAPKSETTALALSLGGTLASAGVMAYGLSRADATGVGMFDVALVSALVTPSLGHIYAGDVLTKGLALRAAGGAIALIGVAQALDCGLFENTCGFFEGGEAAVWLGGGLAVAGAIVDIATAPKAARDHNRKRFSIVPASPGANVGLSFAGTF